MRPDDASPLSIRLFGPFAVRLNGRPLPRLTFRKSQSVLALLALRHGCEVERDWLAALLWPEAAPSAALNSLRKCLTDLRHALDPEAGRLRSPMPRTLCLDLTGAFVDVLAYDAAIVRGDLRSLAEAVALYPGRLLEGWADEWAFEERQVREQRYLAALEKLASLALERGAGGAEGAGYPPKVGEGPDPRAKAERWLRLAVAADPLRESAQRSLMQVLVNGGSYAAALLAYRELRRHLHRELNAEPDPETKALFQQLRTEARRRAARPVTTGPRPEAAPVDPLPRRVPARPLALRCPRSSAQGVAARHCPPDGFLGNLPHELTNFIGREDQMAEIQQWLSVSRLVTLTGAGGCGKSRLAREVGKGLLALPSAVPGSDPGANPAEEYADGVWLIELAPLADPALVPQGVAAPLGVREVPGQALTQTLIESLKSRHLLLLLDNCEHLIEACARLTGTLLQSCPALRILATSREPLGVMGERTYRVPSLSLPPVVDGSWLIAGTGLRVGPAKTDSAPPPTINHQLSTLNQYEAIRLFCERAAAVVPAFALTAGNAAAVAQVCRRLDGIPLAIELAAARLKALPVDAIAARLDDMFRLLTGGSRTALPHHRTLRASIEWSYDLLSEPERALLRRLSVFAGGWALEAAEAVCSDFGFGILDCGLGATNTNGAEVRAPLLAIQNPKSQIQNEEVLDLLTALVEKSLVVYEEGSASCVPSSLPGEGGPKTEHQIPGPEPRYRLLETVRQYSRGRLEAGGAEGAGYPPTVGEGPGPGGEAAAVQERHRDWCLTLAEAAERELKGTHPGPWLDRLERDHDNLRAALAWSVESGQVDAGLQLGCALEEFWRLRGCLKEGMDQLLRLLAQPGPPAARVPGAAGVAPTVTRVRALSSAGRLALIQHSQGLSQRLHEESLVIARELEDRAGIATALLHLGRLATWRWDGTTARPLVEEGLAMRRELGAPREIAEALALLADVWRLQGDLAAERALAEESLALWQALGDRARVSAALCTLGEVIARHGDQDTARPLIEEALATARELNDKVGVAQAITELGNVAHWQEDYPAAQALFEQGLALWRELDLKNGQNTCLFHLGWCHQQQGDFAAAYARFEEALPIGRAYGHGGFGVRALLGDAAADLGRWEEAAARCAESLRSFDLRERSDRHHIAWKLTPLARVALARGRPARAARLLGAAPSLWAATHCHWWPNQRADFERIVSAVRAELGEEEFATAWAEGEAMPVEAVIAEALEEAAAA